MNAVRSGDLCVRPLLLVTVTDFRLDALRARRHLAADPVEILRRQLLRPQIPVASKDYRIGLWIDPVTRVLSGVYTGGSILETYVLDIRNSYGRIQTSFQVFYTGM